MYRNQAKQRQEVDFLLKHFTKQITDHKNKWNIFKIEWWLHIQNPCSETQQQLQRLCGDIHCPTEYTKALA
jgi:hypothetical protein